jgi:threonine dehydrogenase-like Zn-dependent dehydrogenase
VAITTLQVADVQLGDWVVVYGLGAVGNLAAQLFQLAGCRVIGVDPVPARCDLAANCGIERVVAAAGEAASQHIRQAIAGRARHGDGRPDICVDAVGSGAIIADAVNLVAKCGQIVVVGSPRAPHVTNLSAPMQRLFSKWITIRGAMEWRLPRLPGPESTERHTTQGNVRLIFDLVQRGRLHVRPLISHRLPAARIQQAYDGLLQEKDRFTGVVLQWP